MTTILSDAPAASSAATWKCCAIFSGCRNEWAAATETVGVTVADATGVAREVAVHRVAFLASAAAVGDAATNRAGYRTSSGVIMPSLSLS
jgi:hypothetical protein